MNIPVPPAVNTLWQELANQGSMKPSMTKELPEPARRWLEHSISNGTPLWCSVELDMTGEIKLGKQWQPFSARQIISPGEGFIWAARSRMFGLPITGFDRFASGQGQMRWKLLNIIPVLSSTSADVTAAPPAGWWQKACSCPLPFKPPSGHPDRPLTWSP